MADSLGWEVTNLNLYKLVLDHELHDPTGMVGVFMHKLGNTMLVGAKRQVGVETGHLRSSIKLAQQKTTYGQSFTVGSTDSIALLHHTGSRPHIITPNRTTYLRFSSHGKTVYTRIVHHPGTKPNHYLSDQLKFVSI